MYSNQSSQPGMRRPLLNPQQTPFGNAVYDAGSGLIQGGLEAYGERFLGSSSEFMQSNFSSCFSNLQYYFQVNNKYVRSKLKLVLFPFLHRGHWTRMSEPVGDRLSYKPPIDDINAPDLYVPFVAFVTYIVLSGFAFGLLGTFSPKALSLQFTRGLAGWFLQVMMLKGLLYSLGSSGAPFFDIVAYGGYAFAGLSVAILTKLVWNYSYYFMLSWLCFCMGVFLVNTMKRVLFAEMRGYNNHSNRHHYIFIFIAIAQFPLFFWLGHLKA
ncbi:putative Yif1 family protein [Dioscorea sansibarensis]